MSAPAESSPAPPLPVSDYNHKRRQWSREYAQQVRVSRVVFRVFEIISGLIGITTGRWGVFSERGKIQTQIWKRRGAVLVLASRWRCREINT